MQKTITTKSTWAGGMRVDGQARDHHFIIDQPEQMGGANAGANPMEYFLFALGGCLGTVAAIMASQEKIELRKLTVDVEGDFDAAYLMGQTEAGRAGFTEIRVSMRIDAEMTQAEKQAFIDRVDARCPISDNILNETKLVVGVQ